MSIFENHYNYPFVDLAIPDLFTPENVGDVERAVRELKARREEKEEEEQQQELIFNMELDDDQEEPRLMGADL
jgi:hypothetical protein